MSFEKTGGLFRWNCDMAQCHKNYEADDFKEGWSEAKAEGWIAFRYYDLWRHYCPECKKELGD